MVSNRPPQHSIWRSRRAEAAAKGLLVCVIVCVGLGFWFGDDLRDRLTGAARGDELLFQFDDGDPNATIERALKQGANINARDEIGLTPLTVAVSAGRSDVVRRLLAHGADPKIKTGAGLTAVDLAAVRDDALVLQILLDAGADSNETYHGETPLQLAARLHCPHALHALQCHHVSPT